MPHQSTPSDTSRIQPTLTDSDANRDSILRITVRHAPPNDVFLFCDFLVPLLIGNEPLGDVLLLLAQELSVVAPIRGSHSMLRLHDLVTDLHRAQHFTKTIPPQGCIGANYFGFSWPSQASVSDAAQTRLENVCFPTVQWCRVHQLHKAKNVFLLHSLPIIWYGVLFRCAQLYPLSLMHPPCLHSQPSIPQPLDDAFHANRQRPQHAKPQGISQQGGGSTVRVLLHVTKQR
jgi:hypothetical protein